VTEKVSALQEVRYRSGAIEIAHHQKSSEEESPKSERDRFRRRTLGLWVFSREEKRRKEKREERTNDSVRTASA